MSRKNSNHGSVLPDRLPTIGNETRGDSYLVDETVAMDRERRLVEQEGHRHFTKVHAREHPEEPLHQVAPEGELQNSIMQHPSLDSQRFDGIDPGLNPEPPLNTAARTEYDNQKRDQEKEKQERLEHQLGLSNAPKFNPRPQGP